MLIYGREYQMYGSVEAICSIADICPDGKLERLIDIYELPTSQMIKTIAKIILALVNAGEKKKWYEDRSYKPQYVDEDEILSLDQQDLLDCQTEMFGAIRRDTATEVKTEPTKKAKADP